MTLSRLPALDTLRAIGTFWVVAVHAVDLLVPASYHAPVLKIARCGSAALDLFFVLSGFLIARMILTELRTTGGLRVGVFWWRRWVRTLPAYYTMLAVTIAAGPVSLYPWSWGALPSYLLFVQNYAPQWPRIRFSWSWSLCVEEWFYLLLPILALGLFRRGQSPVRTLRLIAAAAFLTSFLGRSYWIAMVRWKVVNLYPTAFATFTWTHLRLDGLAAGIFVSTLPRPAAGPGLIASAIAALASLVTLIAVSEEGFVFFMQYQLATVHAAIFAIIVYASSGENRWAQTRIPGAQTIADHSYAIYLTHYTALTAAIWALPHASGWTQFAAAAGLTFAASLVMRHAIEVPTLRLRDRYGRSLPNSPV
jgi:peptidoglycan/LPS O-acetylase OafA/YrhL